MNIGEIITIKSVENPEWSPNIGLQCRVLKKSLNYQNQWEVEPLGEPFIPPGFISPEGWDAHAPVNAWRKRVYLLPD